MHLSLPQNAKDVDSLCEAQLREGSSSEQEPWKLSSSSWLQTGSPFKNSSLSLAAHWVPAWSVGVLSSCPSVSQAGGRAGCQRQPVSAGLTPGLMGLVSIADPGEYKDGRD